MVLYNFLHFSSTKSTEKSTRYLLISFTDVWIEAIQRLVHHPQRLLQSLFKASSDTHHFSDALHGASNLGVKTSKN